MGSLPGERSLQRQQYYAHPQNQFWRLLSAVIDADLSALPYEARLARLAHAGIGLWDVVASATRKGSLDARIQDHAPNDLRGLIDTLAELRVVAFNGGKADAIGRKSLAGIARTDLVTLPSSSPAYTRCYADKHDAWLALRRWLR